jgi:hypothetical protein
MKITRRKNKKRTYKKRPCKKRTYKKRPCKKQTRNGGGAKERIKKEQEEIKKILTLKKKVVDLTEEIYEETIIYLCKEKLNKYVKYEFLDTKHKQTLLPEEMMKNYNDKHRKDPNFIEFTNSITFDNNGIYVLYLESGKYMKIYIKKEDIPLIFPSDWKQYFPSYEKFMKETMDSSDESTTFEPTTFKNITLKNEG